MFVEFPNRGTPLFKCSPFGYKIRKHACKHITHPHQITLKHPKEHCGIYTKKASRLRSFLRFLADSNRRTRFCRPLTKPLIQGTLFDDWIAKILQFYLSANLISTRLEQILQHFLQPLFICNIKCCQMFTVYIKHRHNRTVRREYRHNNL